MCDSDSINDIIEYNRRTGLSRREFGALTLGAGLISALPAGAATVETTESEVEIKTADGTMDAYFVYPEELKSVARIQVFRDFLVANAQRWHF